MSRGFLGLATFSWVTPLLELGSRRPLQLTDVPPLPQGESTEKVYLLLSRVWSTQEKTNTSRRHYHDLARTILTFVRRDLAFTAVLVTVNTICSFVGPYLLDDLVQFLTGAAEFRSCRGPGLAAILLLSKLVEKVTWNHWVMQGSIMRLRIESGLKALVYEKSLRLSNPSRKLHSSGDIVNYVTVDISQVTACVWYVHTLWLLPLQISLALLVLYKDVGVAAFAALVASIATIWINVPFTGMQERYQEQIMKAKDVRMQATTEWLRSIKTIKLQGWEKKFHKRIKTLRESEYGWLKRSSFARAAGIFIFYASPALVGVVTFGTCSVFKIPLTAGGVLSAIATFRVLQQPLNVFPDALSAAAQARVSLERLSRFLSEEELQKDAVVRHLKSSEDGFVIKVGRADFSWENSRNMLSLSSINLSIREGALVAVCGVVGSGKSSLLSGLLGEVPKLTGKVTIMGSTAYVGQTAWIQSGSIRDNILFGTAWNQCRYEQVLEMCQLKEDLKVLPYGDETEVGERGVALSGGQKQRVQLARAVYHNADIYLLDDPCSALDVQTGTHIFQQVVLGELASKTVVLVTHQVDILQAADMIVVMKDGRITQRGKYQDFLKTESDFKALVREHKVKVLTNFTKNTADDGGNTASSTGATIHHKEQKSRPVSVREEEREKGKDMYWSYCTAYYKGALVLPIILLPVAFQLLQTAGNWWMAKNTTISVEAMPKLIGVYAAFTVGGSLLFLARVLLLSIAGLGTSQIFFDKMLDAIFHAPMSFFDSTPNGSILSRASTDQRALDLDVPFALGALANSVTLLLCVVGVVSQTLWQVVLVFVLIAKICMRLQKHYILSARELERITGMKRVPVVHHLSESMAGATTIQAFEQQSRFTNHNLGLIDNYARPVFHSNAAMQWVSLRLEMLSNVVLAVYLLLLFSLPLRAVNPGLAGLGITYALNIDLPWVISSLCNVEKMVICVERIKQYIGIPSEAAWKTESEAPKGWPSQGEIDLVNLQVRYTESSPLATLCHKYFTPPSCMESLARFPEAPKP